MAALPENSLKIELAELQTANKMWERVRSHYIGSITARIAELEEALYTTPYTGGRKFYVCIGIMLIIFSDLRNKFILIFFSLSPSYPQP